MKYIKYLSYVIRHKYFVLVECWKIGLIWQGITHDLSKLLPSEFFPYAEYFYGCGINRAEFDYAWFLHQKRNKHHWQWWRVPDDNGSTKILEIPLQFRKEMVCDWKGAGKAQGKPNTKEWYLSNAGKMELGRETIDYVEKALNIRTKSL